MMESALEASPNDGRLLRAAGELYGFYGAHLAREPSSARRTTQRGLEYLLLAAGQEVPGLGQAPTMGFEEIEAALARAEKDDALVLRSLGSVWMDWICVREDDLEAIANLARVETIMTAAARLDPGGQAGQAELCLAMLAALQPEEDTVVESLFDRAIAAAAGRTLMPSVTHALWLGEKGHVERSRKLLREIVRTDLPDAPDLMLVNQLALDKARQALAKTEAPR